MTETICLIWWFSLKQHTKTEISFSSGSRRMVKFWNYPFYLSWSLSLSFHCVSILCLGNMRGEKSTHLKTFFHTVPLFQLYLADHVCTWLLCRDSLCFSHYIVATLKVKKTKTQKWNSDKKRCLASLRGLYLVHQATSFPVAAERYFYGLCGSLYHPKK